MCRIAVDGVHVCWCCFCRWYCCRPFRHSVSQHTNNKFTNTRKMFRNMRASLINHNYIYVYSELCFMYTCERSTEKVIKVSNFFSVSVGIFFSFLVCVAFSIFYSYRFSCVRLYCIVYKTQAHTHTHIELKKLHRKSKRRR